MYQISKTFKNQGINYPNKTILNILRNPTYLESTKQSIKYLESQGYTIYGEPNGCGFYHIIADPVLTVKNLGMIKASLLAYLSTHQL